MIVFYWAAVAAAYLVATQAVGLVAWLLFYHLHFRHVIEASKRESRRQEALLGRRLP